MKRGQTPLNKVEDPPTALKFARTGHLAFAEIDRVILPSLVDIRIVRRLLARRELPIQFATAVLGAVWSFPLLEAHDRHSPLDEATSSGPA